MDTSTVKINNWRRFRSSSPSGDVISGEHPRHPRSTTAAQTADQSLLLHVNEASEAVDEGRAEAGAVNVVVHPEKDSSRRSPRCSLTRRAARRYCSQSASGRLTPAHRIDAGWRRPQLLPAGSRRTFTACPQTQLGAGAVPGSAGPPPDGPDLWESGRARGGAGSADQSRRPRARRRSAREGPGRPTRQDAAGAKGPASCSSHHGSLLQAEERTERDLAPVIGLRARGDDSGNEDGAPRSGG